MLPIHLEPQWFADEDFRFRLGTVPGTVKDFFALSREASTVLAERHHWLTTDPQRYAAMLPEAVAIVGELLDLVSSWPILCGTPDALWSPDINLLDRLLMLSERLEPDLVLLAPSSGICMDPSGRARLSPSRDPQQTTDHHEQFTVVAGCVCFPSGWRLTDKLGQSVGEVHQPVPQLNSILGPQIDRLLSRLRSGKCLVRANWGVCGCPEFNQHLDRNLPAIASPVKLNQAWLRREDQCLFTLPRTGGVVFGIRVSHVSWEELRSAPVAAGSVARALRSMPPDMRDYKRLNVIYEELARLLEEPHE